MTAVNNSQFKSYLESISENYECWWNLYTLTDAEGKKKLKKQQEKGLSSPFDFALMVQRVQSKQEQENQEKENQEKEKIERLPVLEGIRKYAKNHVLLVGKPGSGKSTALARLLLEESKAVSSENNTTIPILVELRYWQSSIFERIQAFLQQHDANLNLDETTLKNQLRQGKFLLLIDGINELPSEEAPRQIAIFRKDYPQTPMIFTTRDLGVGGDLGIEKKLEMQPLKETQMREFVMSYLPQQGEEMLQRLGDRLREFGKTPLLLWMLCGLFQQTGDIPVNLGMVFRLFTQSYENSDQLKRNVPVGEESRRWWKSLLEHLAFTMMQGEPVTEFRVAISKQEVEEIFTLNALNDEDKYVRRRAAETLGKIGSEPAVDALVDALNHEDKYVRRRAAEALGKIGSELAVDALIDALNHEDNYIRRRAAEALRKIGSEPAVDALINALNDEDNYIRRRAAEALRKIGSETPVNALTNALNHKYYSVRCTAAEALGKIGSETAVNALINALNHKYYSVRCTATEALGKIGSETAVNALINALNDENPDFRWRAVDALEEIAGSDKITQMWQLLLNDIYETKNIILKIQERYKFYNHEIFHSPPIKEDNNSDNYTAFRTQKILILAAIPHNSRLDKEIRSIEECIRRAVKRDMFEVEIKTAVRSQDIRRAIAEEKPLIVHFCGHGLKDGSLVLEDDGGNDKPVPPSGLAALFQLHADYVKCVVLNACHSIKAAEEICKYINYVIGMNQPIQDTSAIEFAQGFYDGLGYENSDEQDIFQRAFQEGLVALKMDNLSQAEIPVIKIKLEKYTKINKIYR